MILEQSVTQTIPLSLTVSEMQRLLLAEIAKFLQITPFLYLRPPLRPTPSEVRIRNSDYS